MRAASPIGADMSVQVTSAAMGTPVSVWRVASSRPGLSGSQRHRLAETVFQSPGGIFFVTVDRAASVAG